MTDPRSRPLCSRWLDAYCPKCKTKRYMYEGNEMTIGEFYTGAESSQ